MKQPAASASRTIFGVPAVLAASECTALIRDLTQLWCLTYNQELSDMDDDIEICRRFFDPLARGHSLRERLSQLPTTPAELLRSKRGEPLVVDTGEKTLIVGVEARILLALLDNLDLEDNYVVLPPRDVAAAESQALAVYQRWSRARLNQVIALRSGNGHEVMQAISVGLVMALLINRSDVPERAVVRWSSGTIEGKRVDTAIHAGAECFAGAISKSRSKRSAGEQRLKGGYALSEARRRLAHRIIVIPDQPDGGELLYIPEKYKSEVISFLGKDLARRPGLTQDLLSTALDQLVVEFRAVAGKLAHESMVFERSADTRTVMEKLIFEFVLARQGGE
ncbi:hypothetical protein [Streptomyces sp. NPDC059479]|uniref:hypothetical protein n=1 Tax=Streptomyces sp. NPDC059479 TaxID=3346848 RepID=UPI0036BF7FBC